MHCDSSLRDPYPDGPSLREDCCGARLPVRQIWRIDLLRRAIGQQRAAPRSPARSPPLSRTSRSHGPNACSPSIADGANSSAFKSAGIDLRQPRHQKTLHLPIGGRSSEFCKRSAFLGTRREKADRDGTCPGVCFHVREYFSNDRHECAKGRSFPKGAVRRTS